MRAARRSLGRVHEVVTRFEPPADLPPITAADFEARLAEEGVPEQQIAERVAEFDTIRDGTASIVSPAVEKMTGRPPRFFEAFAKDHATDFVRS